MKYEAKVASVMREHVSPESEKLYRRGNEGQCLEAHQIEHPIL